MVKSSWLYFCIIYVNFSLTISVYPAVAALIKPVDRYLTMLMEM